MSTWSELTDGQQNFYLEFFAPMENNLKQLPNNNAVLSPLTYTPFEQHINAVTDTGDRLVRTLNFALSEGQRNAIIGWLEEHRPNHQNIIYN